MKSLILKAIERLAPTRAMSRKAHIGLIVNPDSFLHETGWMNSLAVGHPVDRSGEPIPWMNYGVVSMLAERLNRSLNLFEFGAGYSTLFYAARVNRVTSIEYDERWFEQVRAEMPANVELRYQPQDVDGEYCRSIGVADERYDVVIVDGRDRVNCVRQSIDRLSDGGVMLLDDSNRPQYAEAFSLAASAGFKALHWSGLKPTGAELERTTLFYRAGNCLNI